ncbi:MAG: peroxiredoxin [Coxiella sp. RIFCSPHIGHO2_12_FULL_42_15]|nr:MAG: peroxiredoxin [Coxiella sp. RIFCSPHIGHO2_12_FULL_42_15]
MSHSISLNQPVPHVTFTATNGVTANLHDFHGKSVVLYFYPKDNTPGCTCETKDFRDQFEKFQQANTLIFGISRDTLASHENFKQKLDLPFELISDPDETLCQLFNVINPKVLFGKRFFGVTRSTFLIDSQGILRQAWRKVKVKGHVAEVLQKAESIN